MSGWAHRKFGATWRMCCNLQYMRASRSTKCCNLQYVVVFEISRSFLPICLFSQRILNLKNLIEKLQMRNRVCFLLLCVVCGLPMQSHKSDTRDEKRHMGRNDFLILKARMYRKLQHFVDREARMYCKLQHILHVATNFRCGHLLNRKMPSLSEIEDRLQKACLERSESYSKTIDLTKRLPLSLEPFLLEGRQRFH